MAAAAQAVAPVAERRFVSVLFADLVGFTGLSEVRDSEEVRELLSRYFETCRRLIELYGGTVEKFIGDAVMAVWGTPVATEDDSERAVRAALELVAAVQALGEQVGAAELRARAGVLSGEAAVTLGAEGEGMVAGDLVNTASRVQALAPPGGVFVGEGTRRATEQAVVYESAGSHEVKGKSGLVPVWRALRVVSGGRGALKAEGLEAPFVGRDRELRLLKELFHASAEERKAFLVSVTGIGGIGKSRLGWEFFKYMDGLPQRTMWHRGRCLAYGEGVTYWALADMVRMRCRIAEEEEPASALAKLQATLSEYLLDADERSFVEPRLAHLLGLEERQAGGQEELFGAWRLFFERLADSDPVAMVFEDMHWADASLLDFVEYLLEWSRDHPLYVITLARPELLERRPTWGAGSRTFNAIYLEPLSERAMQELLAGLVPGLPQELRARILARAEGVPLYAVETVRMLLDRGLLVQEGSVYRPVGPIETLEVPETLQALIAARLDGLSAEERRLLQDGAVFGKTFTRQALAAISGLDETQLEPLLAGLVRKEVLSIQADPRSPEHGQYGFLQDLVRRVAYETLSKRERKARHLAAAMQIEQAFVSEQEVVEVLASHYLAAYEAATEDADAEQIKQRAADLLARAGERAASLAASEEAEHYFEQAALLAEGELDRARLLERSGEMALRAGKTEQAQTRFEQALALFADAGERHQAARLSARLGEVEWRRGQLDEALERMERAWVELEGEEPDADIAALAAQLGRLHLLKGELEAGSERLETALELAESLWLPEVLAEALNSSGVIATFRSRLEQAQALIKRALELALEHELPGAALRAFNNLGDILHRRDRCEEAAVQLEKGIALARRVGDRRWEQNLLGELSWSLAVTGRWPEALVLLNQVPEERLVELNPTFLLALPEPLVARGRLEDARHLLSLHARHEATADVQQRTGYRAAEAVVLAAEGKERQALASAEEVLAATFESRPADQAVKVAFPQALEAALALGERERAEQLLAPIEALPAGRLAPSLRAHAARFRARLAADDGKSRKAESGFAAAAGTFREYTMPFWLAVTLAEHGEWLIAEHRAADAEPLLAEARETFERLGASPWLARIEGAEREPRAEVSV
ncbi:MAG TPA: adenylate/guanylate cyclase domain-containing protein [Gaiellaceae bacterium]|nr:adenylate/guanylate cyclase domain-containing protein [Gaiellaceae bacterium]